MRNQYKRLYDSDSFSVRWEELQPHNFPALVQTSTENIKHNGGKDGGGEFMMTKCPVFCAVRIDGPLHCALDALLLPPGDRSLRLDYVAPSRDLARSGELSVLWD